MTLVSDQDRRKLQLTQLQIAAAVASVCEGHGIKYALIAGSALGARRHKGFIPWDDDMDFGMLRADYEKFLAVAKTDLPNHLYLQNWLEDPHMGAPFTKVRLNRSRMIEASSKDTGGHKGIFIDIFPLDNVPRSLAQYPWRAELAFWKRLLRHKIGYGVRKRRGLLRAADLVLIAASRIVSQQTAKRRLHSLMTKYRDQRCDRVVAVGGSYGFEKEALKIGWIASVTRMPFEDRSFFCFSAIDDYLTHLYGDFMKYPPVEQRYNKHVILELAFSGEE